MVTVHNYCLEAENDFYDDERAEKRYGKIFFDSKFLGHPSDMIRLEILYLYLIYVGFSLKKHGF